jgi:hypothetical protein
MIRFLFVATLAFSHFALAKGSFHEFGDEHFYPVVDRSRGAKSSYILISGAVLTAASYNKQYDLTNADEREKKYGALSLGLIGAQAIFDSDAHNYQSHLRGLVYTTGFVFGFKAVLMGRWPGANVDYQPFPSTHTAVAFMSATSLTYSYGWPAMLLAYPAAAFVGYSKLGTESKRLSDVVAGATIGIWLGRASYYENADAAKDLRLQKSPHKSPKLSSVKVLPILSSHQFGTSVYYQF